MKPRAKRRIDPNEIYERRKRRIAIASIAIVAIMLFSSFAYVVLDKGSVTGDRLDYGDYEFSYKSLGDGQVLVTEVDGQEVQFQNLPTYVQYLDVEPRAITLLQNAAQVAWVASPTLGPSDAADVDYARLELSLAIPKSFNAMSEPDERYNMLVLSCQNASAQVPIVYFNISNETKVFTQGNCIIIDGQQRALLSLKDRIIFEYLDILQEGVVND